MSKKAHSKRTVILVQGELAYAATDSENVIRNWKKNLPFYGEVRVIQEPEKDGDGRMIISVPRHLAMKSASFLIPRPRPQVSEAEAARILAELDAVQAPEV